MTIPPVITALEAELAWLESWVDAAITRHFKGVGAAGLPAPPPLADAWAFGAPLSDDERLILILALAPEARPGALDPLLIRNPDLDRRFAEFGGDVDAHGLFRPTLETAAFLLPGDVLPTRMRALDLMAAEGALIRARLITPPVAADGPLFRAPLTATPGAIARLTRDRPHRPELSETFPAKRVTTPLTWDDLILPRATRTEVGEIVRWIETAEDIYADPALARRLKPGFRALFYGPSGTGKTLTAALLGAETGRDVYRVDLSLIVSKWIGETEKNLAAIFDQAEGEGWVLFFDEADALFGKRTEVRQSHDRHANQEVAYILQRVEEFDGVVILASNLKSNIDDAFTRRFQSMIYFPAPGPAERARLWRGAFEGVIDLGGDVDFEALAADFEMTGAQIANVLLYVTLATRAGGGTARAAGMTDLRRGAVRELAKDGRIAEVGG